MGLYLGIDTSNYTTSIALYDSATGEVAHKRRLLPVKAGEKGLRQSEALFEHVKQLPERFEELFCGREATPLAAVAVSAWPRRMTGSYMPCFLAGVSAGAAVAAAQGVPLKRFSHQEGHIMAGLYSAGLARAIPERFYAFHVSGGTTDFLLVETRETGFSITRLGGKADISAGQLIDRTGVLLGLSFPCGPELDRLSLSGREEPVKCAVREGEISFSGFENKVQQKIAQGAAPEDVARFCIDAVRTSLGLCMDQCRKEKDLPVLLIGGVMGNTILRRAFDGAILASAELSGDNAAGTAVLGALF